MFIMRNKLLLILLLIIVNKLLLLHPCNLVSLILESRNKNKGNSTLHYMAIEHNQVKRVEASKTN